MRKLGGAALVALALYIPMGGPAKADDVGALFGGLSGLVLAGPPGALIGVVVGWVFGKPFWGPAPAGACYIDQAFIRHCPDHAQLPVGFH